MISQQLLKEFVDQGLNITFLPNRSAGGSRLEAAGRGGSPTTAEMQVVVPTPTGKRFYRLKKPGT